VSDSGLNEPLSAAEVKKLLHGALATGSVTFSGHALEEMEKDEIVQDEALAVIRGGVVEPGEFERGSWRYRVRSGRVFVVVTFRSADRTVVVTAWRARR
jgi:hypothetical protein